MPELPEVETIRRDLERLIVGKKILGIETDTHKMVLPSLEVVRKSSVGEKITKVSRRAKTIQIFLSSGSVLVLHLKLSGRLLVRDKADKKDDWQRVTLSLSGGKELRFCDLRKFGWLKLAKGEGELNKLLSEFGPEATAVNFEEFKKILAGSRRPIKVVLMDQTKIAGIGNIYAADALNLAKINPVRPANSLSLNEQKKLLEAILKVLKAGISYRGASDQYYLDALGKKGYYQDHFLVYNREGENCFNCGGTIKKSRLAGRGTYFCPVCQK